MMFPMVQVELNRCLSYMSSSNKNILGRVEESESYSSMYRRGRSTMCKNIRRKFHKRMECFLAEGGSCSYDDELIGNIKVPLMYKHLVKQWVPKDIAQLIFFVCVNERIYRISPSSIHRLGLFCMDGIKVDYDRCIELMECVGPCYNYKY